MQQDLRQIFQMGNIKYMQIINANQITQTLRLSRRLGADGVMWHVLLQIQCAVLYTAHRKCERAKTWSYMFYK